MTTPTVSRAHLKAAIQDLLVRDPHQFFAVLREVRDDMEASDRVPERITDEEKARAEVESDLAMLADFFRGFA